jgi:LemA protein
MIGLLVVVLLVAFAGCAGCGTYNSLVSSEEQVEEAWANVETSYQRRADLIPNLVSTVRGAATSEQTILTEVTQARADATRITVSDAQLSDPEAMARFSEAQARLTFTLQRLQEAYPNLQSQGRFADLMTALEGSENRINTARDRYNEAVRDYNTEIRTFPSIIGAKVVHGAEPMVPFEAAEGSQNAPSVDLDNIGAPAQPAAPANDNAGDEAAAAAAN